MTNRRRNPRPLTERLGPVLVAWLMICASAVLPDQVPEDDLDETATAESVEYSSTEESLRQPLFLEASLLQPQPTLMPRTEFQPDIPLPSAALALRSSLFGDGTISPSLLGTRQRGFRRPNADIVFGMEGKARITTDAGSLLRKSPSILGVGVQRRTPIVNDPRVRASRVGQLAAAGSYWLPARIDLDTMLSKIDSRIVDDMIVIKGPYSALYGPGLHFVDVQLLGSPRYAGGFQSHGSTSFDYEANGEQCYGRQSLFGGSDDWGYRVGYGHRTGNDYLTGSGDEMPSSYKSRDIDVALGGRSLLQQRHRIQLPPSRSNRRRVPRLRVRRRLPGDRRL